MNESRNFILAVALSIMVLLGWQYFFMVEPAPGPQTQSQPTASQTAAPASSSAVAPDASGDSDSRVPEIAPQDPGAPAASRMDALAGSPRLAVDTPLLQGSIALRGARFDDLILTRYHESVSPESPEIELFSPPGAAETYFAEYGWTAAADTTALLPGQRTVWSALPGARLTPQTPVVLTWDNGAGLIFRRTIEVDDGYLFTVTQSVENLTSDSVTLFPYALITRHGTPQTTGFYILHEGLIGVFGETGLEEVDYDDVQNAPPQRYETSSGWLGITDKYWAAVLVPDQGQSFTGRFSESPDGQIDIYQADYLLEGVAVQPNASASVTGRLFAGAKQVSIIDQYGDQFGILKFDLLIDWGWFYFLTKPLFLALDWLHRLSGNFGLAILALTVGIKLVFFPLANRSYVAMSKMKKLQPDMVRLREQYKDDRTKQQQELMQLYKKEKVNPISGCLPVVLQIPVFFALYKVLFVTIEMRHAPFYGWIRDLSAPDPTSLFNLFGVLPWTPPDFLNLGAWPIIMGVTMMVQMKMNPAPADPIQQKIFTLMPIFFTFILAGFPAGLVIYWAWNNFLSVLQQGVIMHRQGVPIEILGNFGLPGAKTDRKPDKDGTHDGTGGGA